MWSLPGSPPKDVLLLEVYAVGVGTTKRNSLSIVLKNSQVCRPAPHGMLPKRASPHFSLLCQRVGSGMSTFCIELRRSARLPVVAQASVCVLFSAPTANQNHTG